MDLYKAMKDCERKVQKSLESPTVKLLREHMEKAGCPVKDTFFKVIYCRDKHGGSYASSGGGISVCGNFRQRQDSVTQVIIHELIHAFDDCRAANVNWRNCAHHACNEIRANRLSGDCHFKRELLRGILKIRGHEPECIKKRVLKSLSSNPICAGSTTGKDSMEAVWIFVTMIQRLSIKLLKN